MRRVVVTGLGIVSSIGNSAQEVTASLREAKSGIGRAEDYARLGFRCQVHGAPEINVSEMVDRRALRFHGGGTAWNHVAMDQAIRDAGLEGGDISNERTGIVMGSGGPSTRIIVEAADITRDKGPKRVGPFAVPKAMSSTASATLATWFGIKGVNYSISSACATSSHCIGNAAEMIQWGKQDVMFAGGCEDLDWTLSVLFDAMGAMSHSFNDTPETASRAYDVTRDGFVIAGGAGVLVLEELEHAKARGARIYGELVGYGATSDGHDMVQPSGEGAVRCMRQALERVDGAVDYINPHATSTPIGDLKEVEALREVFGDNCPPVSATKSLTGHSLGAAGVQEAIYSLLMMQGGFICEIRQHHRARSRLRRHADRARAARRRRDQHRAVELLRLRRHQRGAGVPALRCVMEVSMGEKLLSGKRGLVMGVANDHSIAWGIARTLAAHGAELAFTYQGEAFGRRVRPLAESVGANIVVPCDVEDVATVDAAFDRLAKDWGSIDFVVHAVAFSDRSELKGRYADTSRENFVRTMVISCFSFTEVAKRAAALMTDGGSLLTLTYAGSTRVMPNYNVMGVAKAALEFERPLSRRRLRPGRHPRQRHLGRAGADACRRRHHRRAPHVQLSQVPRAAAARDIARRCRGGGALSPVAAVVRRHRRGAFRGFRLSRHLDAASPGRRADDGRQRDRRHEGGRVGRLHRSPGSVRQSQSSSQIAPRLPGAAIIAAGAPSAGTSSSSSMAERQVTRLRPPCLAS